MPDFHADEFYEDEEIFSIPQEELPVAAETEDDFCEESFDFFNDLEIPLDMPEDPYDEGEEPEPGVAEEEDDEDALERELAKTLWDLRNKDVVSTISEYRRLRRKHDQLLNPYYFEKYGDMTVEDLLLYYHSGDVPADERAWLREQIYLAVFFLLPYAVRKGYSMRAQIFSDAMQNMSVAVLQAIEMFKPGLGYKFSNYLIGYFRGGITKTVRESVVVSSAPAKKKTDDAGEQNSVVKSASQARKKLIGEGRGDDETEGDENEYENTWYRYARQSGVPPVMPDGDTPVGDPDSMDYKVHNNQLVEWLEEALSREAGVLTEDEARVIILHYGLFGNRPHIYPEIAEIRKAEGRGCACSRISQINTHAIAKLRKWFEERNIEE